MSTFRWLSLMVVVSLWHLLAVSASATEEPAGKTFDAKGVKIHYFVQGKGEPVVLIHGLYSSANLNWQKTGVVDALAKDHQVIAFDLPGHGESDKPEKEEAYGNQMAEDVALLMDHLEIKKAHIVGYSLGGIVALKFIVNHPDRALSGTLGGMGWLKEGSPLQKTWEGMGREGGKVPKMCIGEVSKLALPEEAVKGVKVPIEIVVGDHDPVRKMYVAPLEGVRSDWKVVEIEGAGHITCIMKKQFAEEIVNWVGKNAQK